MFVAAISIGLGHLGPIWNGVGSAQARETYTRKPMHDVWITGHFTQKQSYRVAGLQAHASSRLDPVRSTLQTAEAAAQVAESSPPVSPAIEQDKDARQKRDPMALLRQGLEARAKMMAAMAPAAPPTLRVLTYDFETGYRTAIYTDGSIRREPFDKASIGAIVETTQ